MTIRILEDSDEITPEIVREWGYDEELYLMEQDEDLLLYDLQYFPVLLELVSDEKCPKSEYAFVILCQFCREVVVLHKIRGLKSLEKLSNFINSMKKPDSGYASSWFSYVNSLLAYIEQTGPVDNKIASQMSNDLLLGFGRVGELKETESGRSGWCRFTLKTSVTEHIDVCYETGKFVYVPYYNCDLEY